jgi:DNA invertase Pin-like site-specific DNA recombinase
LRDGDVLVVWKLDRLGWTLAHLVNTVKDLSDRNIGLRVLTGKGAQIDTTTASGRMEFDIFATLAEFERDLIRERTMAGLAAGRARGRKGGRKFALTKAQVRLAQAANATLQCPICARNSGSSASLSNATSAQKANSGIMESVSSA